MPRPAASPRSPPRRTRPASTSTGSPGTARVRPGRVPLPTYPFERQYIPRPPTNPEADSVPAGTVRIFTEGQSESPAPDRLNGTHPHTVRVEAANGSGPNGRYTLVLEDKDGRVLTRLAYVSLTGDLSALAVPLGTNGAAGRALDPLPAGLLHELRWQPRPLAAPARSRSAPTSCSPTTASPSTSSGASRRAAAG